MPRAASRGQRCPRTGRVHDHRGRPCGQHRHDGDHLCHRQYCADRHGHRSGSRGNRARNGGDHVELRRRRLRRRLRPVPELARTARARGPTSAPPTRRRPTRRAGTPPPPPTGSTTCASSPPTTSATAVTSATIANVRVDNTAPTGSITRLQPRPMSRATFSRHLELGGCRVGGRERAVPTLTCRRQHVDERGGCRHHDAVLRELGHHGRQRTGLYDLQVTTTDKAGNTFTSPTHHQRARGQHRARRLGRHDGRYNRRLPERQQDLLQVDHRRELRLWSLRSPMPARVRRRRSSRSSTEGGRTRRRP